jgi:hypothetical protein
MNNTAVNPSFVICQLFYVSFQEGGEHREEEKLGEFYCQDHVFLCSFESTIK